MLYFPLSSPIPIRNVGEYTKTIYRYRCNFQIDNCQKASICCLVSNNNVSFLVIDTQMWIMRPFSFTTLDCIPVRQWNLFLKMDIWYSESLEYTNWKWKRYYECKVLMKQKRKLKNFDNKRDCAAKFKRSWMYDSKTESIEVLW